MRKKYLNSIHYLNFAINSYNERKIFNNLNNHYFISFSNEIVYEKSILDKLSCDILLQHNTFLGYAKSYNYFLKNFKNCKFSSKLCNKRLAETWFYYRYVLCNIELQNYNMDAFFIKDLDSYLARISTTLVRNFTNKWSSSQHTNKCFNDKCCNCLVIDGNHKVNRLKCCYENVDYQVKELGSKFK